MHLVIDNVLPAETLDSMFEIMFSPEKQFPWYYYNSMVTSDCTDDPFDYQFTHVFSYGGDINSAFFEPVILPLLCYITPDLLLRAKANLQMRTPYQRKTNNHIDIDGFSTGCTAIFYMNTNNGKTIIDDKIEVESIANRLVVFPSHTLHCGASTTDTKFRSVINLNFTGGKFEF